MEIELLIEIAYSSLNEKLCNGCTKYGSPYSYKNDRYTGSCNKCRCMAAEEIKSILEKQKNN